MCSFQFSSCVGHGASEQPRNMADETELKLPLRGWGYYGCSPVYMRSGHEKSIGLSSTSTPLAQMKVVAFVEGV